MNKWREGRKKQRGTQGINRGMERRGDKEGKCLDRGEKKGRKGWRENGEKLGRRDNEETLDEGERAVNRSHRTEPAEERARGVTRERESWRNGRGRWAE